MVTKKDYIALADALSGAFPISENVTPIQAWKNTVVAVMESLAKDNTRFSGAKFVAKVIGSDNINGGNKDA